MPFPFPDELLDITMVNQAVEWIIGRPVDRKKVRKYMIIEWCRLTGHPLTKELVSRVYKE